MIPWLTPAGYRFATDQVMRLYWQGMTLRDAVAYVEALHNGPRMDTKEGN